jgi:hypothetical protein
MQLTFYARFRSCRHSRLRYDCERQKKKVHNLLKLSLKISYCSSKYHVDSYTTANRVQRYQNYQSGRVNVTSD